MTLTMDGDPGMGALRLRVRPASSTALQVSAPKAPIMPSFCLKSGLLSNYDFTLPGVKNTIISGLRLSSWLMSLMTVL